MKFYCQTNNERLKVILTHKLSTKWKSWNTSMFDHFSKQQILNARSKWYHASNWTKLLTKIKWERVHTFAWEHGCTARSNLLTHLPGRKKSNSISSLLNLSCFFFRSDFWAEVLRRRLLHSTHGGLGAAAARWEFSDLAHPDYANNAYYQRVLADALIISSRRKHDVFIGLLTDGQAERALRWWNERKHTSR